MASPSREHIPHACGVYIMRDASGEALYVGKAKDLAKRVAQYFNPNKPDLKNQTLAPLVRSIDYIHCASEREALIWEQRLVRQHQPFFNVMLKDGKSYPYIVITMGEDYPRIGMTRRKADDGSVYFGPYPRTTIVRRLLRDLWRMRLFPLRPCDSRCTREEPPDRKKVHSCLYYHTGECPAPCAGRIAPEAYRRIALDAALFFKGRTGELRRRFEREMRRASARLDFERAAKYRDHIQALDHMAERVRCQEVPPGKVAERLDASRAVTDLQEALGLQHPPHRVECFDISHLFGRGTVGSMVVFEGGKPYKDGYRRFRIRSLLRGPTPEGTSRTTEISSSGTSRIDDFAAMREVVQRRLREVARGLTKAPDLMVVDGGKGQLSAAQEALAESQLRIPLAALAKREEEVFLPGRSEALLLERDRPALRLLQRLRDEAHRFAISYHRFLRRKEMFHGETIR